MCGRQGILDVTVRDLVQGRRRVIREKVRVHGAWKWVPKKCGYRANWFSGKGEQEGWKEDRMEEEWLFKRFKKDDGYIKLAARKQGRIHGRQMRLASS